MKSCPLVHSILTEREGSSNFNRSDSCNEMVLLIWLIWGRRGKKSNLTLFFFKSFPNREVVFKLLLICFGMLKGWKDKMENTIGTW